MLSTLLKKHRLDNLNVILASFISFLVSIATYSQTIRIETGLSLIGTNPRLFSLLLATISGLSLLSSSLILVTKNRKILNEINKDKIMMTLKVVMIFVASLLVVDLLILGIARAYVIGSSVERFPADGSFIVKMMYLITRYSNLIFTGIQSTIFLSLMGTIIGLILAIFLVILRTQDVDKRDSDVIAFSKKIGLMFVKTYVTIIRGTPMIVQAMIFFYLMREVFFAVGFSVAQVNAFWTPFLAGLFTVSINTTAYLIEVLRGGIIGVDKGQIEAGRSLGFSSFKTYLLITFPQALRNSMPAIGNEFIVNIKDTAVLTLIQVVDLFAVTRTIAGNHYSFVEAFIIAAVIYLVLTYGTSKILAFVEKKLEIKSKEIVSSN
jgi:ABC-type amino acid transport system permease subunit